MTLIVAVAFVPACTVSDHSITMRVLNKHGLVQYRPSDSEPWQRVKVKMTLHPEGEFRTGPRSRVEFVAEDGESVVLEELTTLKVADSIRFRSRMREGTSSRDVPRATLRVGTWYPTVKSGAGATPPSSGRR